LNNITGDEIRKMSESLHNDFRYLNEECDKIATEYSRDLDEKVDRITWYLKATKDNNLDFDVPSLQRMAMELSAIIYYANDRLEKLQILSDMAEIKYRDKYNESYLSKQGAKKLEDRTLTKDQVKSMAEQESLPEELISFIYSHAAKILKGKIDSAYELLKSVSKSLSAEITQMQQFSNK